MHNRPDWAVSSAGQVLEIRDVLADAYIKIRDIANFAERHVQSERDMMERDRQRGVTPLDHSKTALAATSAKLLASNLDKLGRIIASWNMPLDDGVLEEMVKELKEEKKLTSRKTVPPTEEITMPEKEVREVLSSAHHCVSESIRLVDRDRNRGDLHTMRGDVTKLSTMLRALGYYDHDYSEHVPPSFREFFMSQQNVGRPERGPPFP